MSSRGADDAGELRLTVAISPAQFAVTLVMVSTIGAVAACLILPFCPATEGSYEGHPLYRVHQSGAVRSTWKQHVMVHGSARSLVRPPSQTACQTRLASQSE